MLEFQWQQQVRLHQTTRQCDYPFLPKYEKLEAMTGDVSWCSIGNGWKQNHHKHHFKRILILICLSINYFKLLDGMNELRLDEEDRGVPPFLLDENWFGRNIFPLFTFATFLNELNCSILLSVAADFILVTVLNWLQLLWQNYFPHFFLQLLNN